MARIRYDETGAETGDGGTCMAEKNKKCDGYFIPFVRTLGKEARFYAITLTTALIAETPAN